MKNSHSQDYTNGWLESAAYVVSDMWSFSVQVVTQTGGRACGVDVTDT